MRRGVNILDFAMFINDDQMKLRLNGSQVTTQRFGVEELCLGVFRLGVSVDEYHFDRDSFIVLMCVSIFVM